ncbi:MAG TPA: hypothetical protein VF704_07080, partial [Allosphingosinicella sp.]
PLLVGQALHFGIGRLGRRPVERVCFPVQLIGYRAQALPCIGAEKVPSELPIPAGLRPKLLGRGHIVTTGDARLWFVNLARTPTGSLAA